MELVKERKEIIRFLNTNKAAVDYVLDELRIALGDINVNSISSLGLQTILKQHTVGNKGFRDLLANKKCCRVILYLSSLGSNYKGLDKSLQIMFLFPIFKVENAYTGTQLSAYIWGIENRHGVGINKSLLADILFNVPVPSIFVLGNGYDYCFGPNINTIEQSVRCYEKLFENLEDVANDHGIKLSDKSEAEQALLERYDPKKWSEYKTRFVSLSKDFDGYNIGDGAGDKIEKFTAESVIKRKLALTSGFSHFCLDPKHLKSILGSNYGNFKDEFFKLIDIMIASTPPNAPRQDYPHRATAIQLFNRLLLLEYECAKDQILESLDSGVKPGHFDAFSC